MKKFTFALISLLALSITVKAQQYVSTEPANRNVILEEFTGRNCGYCTDGHRIANQIMAANPGRVWAINVHSGGYAPTSYPNFNTSVSASILGGFSVDGFPSGVVNRSTSAGQNRSAWSGLATQQLAQASECNVAGVARINPETRVATITVEVYYTGNSTANENYLTVAMLQDSILGSQSDYGNYNPTQWLNGQYVHMHILRDIVTPTWGEAISPTTAGTLVTKTYEYQIPEVIGNPNGVDVVLDHIIFLAWVAERYQGTPTRPILTACELEKTTVTDQPIYPSIMATEQVMNASCSHMKSFRYELANLGTETITSIKYTAEVEGSSQDFEWTGELASGDKTKLEFDMEIPFGTFVGTINITEVNGEAYERSFEFDAECSEWAEVEIEEETTNVKLYIIQDQFGEQITWNIINSTGAVVASGGPYQHLMGSGSTQPNVEIINDLPADECYLFRIFDSNGNGICCNYGEGYYYIKDAAGNRIIEGDGAFGSMASHLFSINKKPDVVGENPVAGLIIYPNPANNKICVDGEDVSVVEIYNSLGQRVLMVEGSDKTSVDVAAFGNGVYVVRAITNEGNVTTKKVTIAH
ncbi:MAG: Omp28-related outer membrane protein [Bacteroidales bacterium]|nr:Omp28-related outer membrane protein [Bacteroidales bacterium]